MNPLDPIVAMLPEIEAAMNGPVPLSHLEADVMELAACEESWINVSWIRAYLARPPGCPSTLAAVDRLVAIGLLETYTPEIPAGDPRRLDDDVRLTARARAMCTQAGHA